MGKVSKETMLRALKRKGTEETSQEPREKRSKKGQDRLHLLEGPAGPSKAIVEVKNSTSAKLDAAVDVAIRARQAPKAPGSSVSALGNPETSVRLLNSALLVEDVRVKKEQTKLAGFASSMASLYEVLAGLVSLQEQRSALEDREQRLTGRIDDLVAKQKELEALVSLKDTKVQEAHMASMDKDEEILRLRDEVGPLQGKVDELSKLVEAQREEIKSTAEKAVAQFRSSEEYQDELSLECISSYQKGFKECKTKVKEKFPDVDTSLLTCELGEEEEEEKEVPPGAAEAEAVQPTEIIDITQADEET